MNRISQLLYKRIVGTLTPDETEELNRWIASDSHNAEVARRMSDLSFLEKEYLLTNMVDSSQAKEDMERRISHRKPRIMRVFAYVAASIAVILFTATAVLYINRESDSVQREFQQIAIMPVDSINTFEEIKPGKTMARLTDSSGHTINLDEKTADKIVSTTIHSKPADKRHIADLKLEVPRGGEFKIILEDSTEVWLNSESTLKYPESFGTYERRVELTGEAYFSVKPDKDRPFYVVSGGQQVKVYGTTFNIRGYDDESSIRTTLETGSISLGRRYVVGGEVMLSPGHQGVFNKDSRQVELRSVNPGIITGWRHGKFVFEDQTLEQIMRDLSRWYNFKYEFSDRKAAEVVFKGSIPRYSELATAILILETSGGISFSLTDDDTILVSSTHNK